MGLTYQDQFYSDKVHLIVGTDEAGRGPLAGPVVAAAVIFPQDYQNDKINDSKQLSEKQRKALFSEIKEHAIAVGVGIVSADEIDQINIYEAARKAMKLAIADMKHDFDLVLTDCMKLPGYDVPVIDIVKGDAKALPIAAASIIAKVTRDEMMDELDKEYPNYKFSKNKGYGTKEHLDALKKYGPIEHIHRKTFKPVEKILHGEMNLFEDF